MDLYISLVDIDGNPKKPDCNYDGELIQHVIVKNKHIRDRILEIDAGTVFPEGTDFVFTTAMKYRDKIKIIAYVNSKRLTSKTILKERALIHESTKLLEGIIMDIKLGFA